MRSLGLLLLSLALAACQAPAPQAPAPAEAPAPAAPVRAVGRLLVQAPAVGYALRATALPYAQRHLQRLEIYLATGQAGAPWLVATVGPGQFAEPVLLDYLVASTTYRCTVKAWQPDTDAVGSPLVEAQDDARSVTTFTTGGPGSTLDLDAAGGIQVWLKGRDLSLAAPGALTVTPGALLAPSSPETLSP
jgi:hypothetical protein